MDWKEKASTMAVTITMKDKKKGRLKKQQMEVLEKIREEVSCDESTQRKDKS